MGLLVTGDPVKMRRITASRPTLHTDLVRLAWRFLMVVDSSTAIRTRNFLTNNCATETPFFEEKASMFISSSLSFPVSVYRSLSSLRRALVRFGFHRRTSRSTRSGKWVSISPIQFAMTPLGATMSAKLIRLLSKQLATVSKATFVFPVPMSISSA